MAKAMPSLILDVEQNGQPQAHSPKHHSPAHSGSSSPVRPTYSPITPVLGAARLATPPPPPQRIYTHSQPPQSFIPAPLPPRETISLDSNPDALALRSAISILQIQSRRATSDIQTLHQIKERALADPTAFAEALSSGKIKSASDPLFGPSFSGGTSSSDDSDDSDAEAIKDSTGKTIITTTNSTTTRNPQAAIDSNGDTAMTGTTHAANTQSWPPLPKLQSVVRTPPINWTQYGIVGESLDKLHADQVARPMEGLPARIGLDGQAAPVEGGKRNEGLGVAAPYTPSRDKIEKAKKKQR